MNVVDASEIWFDFFYVLLYVQARACPAGVKAHEREFLIYFIFFLLSSCGFIFISLSPYSTIIFICFHFILFHKFVGLLLWSSLFHDILIFLLRFNEFTHIEWMN